MNLSSTLLQLACGGIQIYGRDASSLNDAEQTCLTYLHKLGLDRHVVVRRRAATERDSVCFRLSEVFVQDWAPRLDTTLMCQRIGLHTETSLDHLELEIVIAMLMSPVAFEFPGADELMSAIQIRKNIVLNGRLTALEFDTDKVERPPDYWSYNEATGFTLKPHVSLITGLQKATQPGSAQTRYCFSCYRATEYVMLLSIAQELVKCNPPLLANIERQWQIRAVTSASFHESFLREYGTEDDPIPLNYYVPGDRVWFRNPDEASSFARGYEGSWVLYLGGGFFTNFWKPTQPYTLATKCLEIYHWRHATYRDSAGELKVDDDVVTARVAETFNEGPRVQSILDRMMRLRDPSGLYRDGGCIDKTREASRWVAIGTSDIRLPDVR